MNHPACRAQSFVDVWDEVRARPYNRDDVGNLMQ